MTTPKDALYKQRQEQDRDRQSTATLLVPTLPTRINRLNPQERAEVKQIIRGLKLRKIVRRTLAEAFWAGEEQRERAERLREVAETAIRRFDPEYDRAETFFNQEQT